MRNITISDRKLLSKEKYPLELIRFTFTSAEGQTIEKNVEVYERPSAATILLYDPGNRTVLLTEQVRLPAFINGGDESLTETCAGLIDDGEDAETTAVREVKEELGYTISEVKKVFDLYSSPGGNTELISYFIGKYSPRDKTSDGGGKHDEGEDITLVELTFEQALERLRSGQIRDAKTVVLLQYAALNGIFV